jgi:hypothetical protein
MSANSVARIPGKDQYPLLQHYPHRPSYTAAIGPDYPHPEDIMHFLYIFLFSLFHDAPADILMAGPKRAFHHES